MRIMSSWETPWMSLASFVIVLWMISITVIGDALGTSSNSNLDLPSPYPCPDPEVIAPCWCSYGLGFGMRMNCSLVTSEDELRRIFSNEFPSKNFTELDIINNNNITSLREGDLGSVSFRQIYIENTSLSEIETEALNGSFHTLVLLRVCYSRLEAIPHISNFLHLQGLEIYGNQINNISIETSATLSVLDLRFNQIDDVPQDVLITLTSLQRLNLAGNSLTEIHPHTFTRYEQLFYLNLGRNKLTTIPDDAIIVYGRYTVLDLYENQITSLTYEAVSSVNGYLGVDGNNLTELPEKVFRPLLEDYVLVEIEGNPLKCGCDMAWLVLNRTLQDSVPDLYRAKCPDGEVIGDLNPQIYRVMCPNTTAVPLKLQ